MELCNANLKTLLAALLHCLLKALFAYVWANMREREKRQGTCCEPCSTTTAEDWGGRWGMCGGRGVQPQWLLVWNGTQRPNLGIMGVRDEPSCTPLINKDHQVGTTTRWVGSILHQRQWKCTSMTLVYTSSFLIQVFWALGQIGLLLWRDTRQEADIKEWGDRMKATQEPRQELRQ